MKIVCGSCQAKYSIADEKVAGKVFRIRCKRCGEVIVVRGDQDSPEAAAGSAAAAPDTSHDNERTVQGPTATQSQLPAAASETPADAIWHVVINGEQAGPYSPSQLAELVASGQLDWEAYVWSEGFDNWQPMRDVPDLVNAISGTGQSSAPAAQGGVPVSLGRPAATANTQMGRDPFADEAPAQQQVFAKAAGGTGGVVHTSSRNDPGATALSSFESASPGIGSSGGHGQGPRVSAQQTMTGSRNENSVLFSLKNLQALATGSMPPGAATPSVRPGQAAGEGSGLIDIRALATTTGVEANKNTEKDALLALGSAQAGAFGGLGSPMLTPGGKSDDEENKKPLVFAIVGGCALLAVAGIAVALIMRGGSSPAEVSPVAPAAAPIVAGTPPTAAAPATPAVAPPSAAAAPPTEALSEGEQAARAAAAKANEAAAAKPVEEPKPGSPQHAAGKHPGSNASSEKAPEPAATAAAPAATATKPADKPKANSSLDDLLNDAIGGKGNSLGTKAAPAGDLPEKPSRDDVLKAMKGVTDAVKACSPGQAGVAFANVTVIGKTGRVGNVEITGITGEPGSCIARAVRKASFPKFSSENFQVKFPFRL
jgi:predicted Zn finger-like uncharacterized protein